VSARPAIGIGVVTVTALVLQTAVLPRLAAGRLTPDLLLIICVYLGLHRHTVGGALGAFALGYLQDAFSGPVAGLNAFGMCLVFTTVYLTSRRLWVDNTVSKVVVVFLASVLKTSAVVVLIAIFLSTEWSWRTLLGYLLGDAVLTAACSPAVFAVLSRVQRAPVTEDAYA
jgi:rod shape-determining protein MreD